jgi:hypothetical protein
MRPAGTVAFGPATVGSDRLREHGLRRRWQSGGPSRCPVDQALSGRRYALCGSAIARYPAVNTIRSPERNVNAAEVISFNPLSAVSAAPADTVSSSSVESSGGAHSITTHVPMRDERVLRRYRPTPQDREGRQRAGSLRVAPQRPPQQPRAARWQPESSLPQQGWEPLRSPNLARSRHPPIPQGTSATPATPTTSIQHGEKETGTPASPSHSPRA